MADFDLQTLLICPDRKLADAFLETVPQHRAFQILGDLKAYPTDQALEMRLRQLEPDVVLLDLASDAHRGAEIIARVVQSKPGTQVVGLHISNEAEVLVSSLRRGASEFLYAPFAANIQQEAIGRIRRLLRPRAVAEREAGRIVSFSSAKPGSGATTLALEMAMTLEKQTSGRVLLIDGDLAGGTLFSIADAAAGPETVTLAGLLSGHSDANWNRRTLRIGGVELLPAPPEAFTDAVDLTRLNEVLESARRAYTWVVVDLPIIPERISLMAAALSDSFFLVSTGELPSLHLSRRALGVLQSLGFAKRAIRILVNRMSKKDGLVAADLEKVFGTRVDALLPQDYQAIHGRAASQQGPAQILGSASELGRAIQTLTTQLVAAAAQSKSMNVAEPQPA